MKVETTFYTNDCEVKLTFHPGTVSEKLKIAEGIEYALQRLISSEEQWNILVGYAKAYLEDDHGVTTYRDVAEAIVAIKFEEPFLMDDVVFSFHSVSIPF